MIVCVLYPVKIVLAVRGILIAVDKGVNIHAEFCGTAVRITSAKCVETVLLAKCFELQDRQGAESSARSLFSMIGSVLAWLYFVSHVAVSLPLAFGNVLAAKFESLV